MSQSHWVPKTRDYSFEIYHREGKPHPIDARSDPLSPHFQIKKKQSEIEPKQAPVSPIKETKTPAKKQFDPLSMMAAAAESSSSKSQSVMFDPLATTSSSSSSSNNNMNDISLNNTNNMNEFDSEEHYFESWTNKQPRILSTYSTSTRVAVTANFMEEVDEGQSVRAVDKAQSRLEELASATPQNDQQKNYLTQKEYISHMEEQLVRLKKAWQIGERVVSLKIAIQCAKLLGDNTSVPQFYPSMYVLLSNILDTFGDLVYDRLKVIASQGMDAKLPDDFTCKHVCPDAQLTCKNWFYKTACIRELMPRLYIDLALIKSYRFVTNSGFESILTRLSRAIRGVGDPLVAMYARCYLANKARQLNAFEFSKNSVERPLCSKYQKVLLEAYDDFMFTMKALRCDNFQKVKHVSTKKVTVDEYLFLFSPALEWLCQNIGYGANQDLFFALLDQYKAYFPNSVVLMHLLGSFGADYISQNGLSLCGLIKESEESSKINNCKIYLALGKALVKCSPPEKQKLPILNDVWKVVTKVSDPLEYLEIADVFIQFLILNFSDREVNIFLKDVIKHVKQATQDEIQSEPFQKYLSNIIQKQIEHTRDLVKTLSMDNFLSMMDLLEKVSKVPVAKMILTQFGNNNVTSNDPVIIHTLMDVAKSLHDSIDAQSFEDEKKQIANTIITMIRQIDFKRDLEQQLNFYVDCRQAFSRLDIIVEELIMRVLLLCYRALKMMKNKHTKKTSAFVKACLAYCHITVPSLSKVFLRLRLLMHCGECALQNGMISQGEAFLKAAISLIKDVPTTVEEYHLVRNTEKELEAYILNFASLLLLVPGHPKQGPFYLLQGLINTVSQYEPWNNGNKIHPAKTRIFISFISLLCAYYQRNFIYSSVRVEANDSLYGGDEETYIKPLRALLDFVVERVLQDILALEGEDLVTRRNQGLLSLQLVNVIISSLEMNKSSAKLVVKLIGITKKNGNAVDPKYFKNTILHISNMKGTWYEDVTREINKLP